MSIASELRALEKPEPKILTIDIETAPNLAAIWSLWDLHVGIDQIQQVGSMISVAAKWENNDKVMFFSDYHTGHKEMIVAIHGLLSEADVVQGWNSKRFDEKWLNSEFLLQGLFAPRPYKTVDLMTVVKSRFMFPSYKLDFVSQRLGVGKKIGNERGWKLWQDCIFGTPEQKATGWKEMRLYNCNDVVITENVKHAIRGWIHNYPAVGSVRVGDAPDCFVCHSTNLKADGVFRAGVYDYPQYQCLSCGTWMKGSTSIGRSSNTTGIK
jgi:RNase_H superfamily